MEMFMTAHVLKRPDLWLDKCILHLDSSPSHKHTHTHTHTQCL